jgi:2-methylcitrate dehydratase PrpD
VRLRTKSGEELPFDATYAKGHYRNPATPAELETKFRSLAERVVSPEQRQAIHTALEDIEACDDVATLIDSLIWK